MSGHNGLVKVNLLTMLAGLGVQSAVTIVVAAPTAISIMNGTAFLILVANFYHAKIIATSSADECSSDTQNSVHALVDYWLNLGIWFAISFMSFYIAKPKLFWTWNLVLTLVDLVLVAISIKTSKGSLTGLLLRAHKIWFWFNIAFSVLAIGMLAGVRPGRLTELVGTVIICLAIIGTTLGDYLVNRKLYFGDVLGESA